MRVHSYDDRGEVGEFEPGSGSLRVYRRSVVPHRNSPVQGQYSILNRRLTVLYREGGALKVFLQDVGLIDVSAGITASWQLASKNKARLAFDTEPPAEVVYRSSFNRVAAHIAASPQTTREDLDFGLFVANVLKSEDRRAQLYVPPET